VEVVTLHADHTQLLAATHATHDDYFMAQFALLGSQWGDALKPPYPMFRTESYWGASGSFPRSAVEQCTSEHGVSIHGLTGRRLTARCALRALCTRSLFGREINSAALKPDAVCIMCSSEHTARCWCLFCPAPSSLLTLSVLGRSWQADAGHTAGTHRDQWSDGAGQRSDGRGRR